MLHSAIFLPFLPCKLYYILKSRKCYEFSNQTFFYLKICYISVIILPCLIVKKECFDEVYEVFTLSPRTFI